MVGESVWFLVPWLPERRQMRALRHRAEARTHPGLPSCSLISAMIRALGLTYHIESSQTLEGVTWSLGRMTTRSMSTQGLSGGKPLTAVRTFYGTLFTDRDVWELVPKRCSRNFGLNVFREVTRTRVGSNLLHSTECVVSGDYFGLDQV